MFSLYILTVAAAWLTGQGLKYIFGVLKNGRWADTSTMLTSGNMPSVHTATTVALTVTVGIKDGTDSGLFALSLLLTGIVAYDAMVVRRSSGEQGTALLKLIKPNSEIPYLALGHRPIEVGVGAIIGIIVSLIVVFFASNLL